MKDYSDIEKALPGMNQEYRFGKLEESDLAGNPFEQFVGWLEEAVKDKVAKPNAMVLSTVSKQNSPSSRIVLLKGFSEKGFVFYTHYSSPKAKDLAVNPNAALLFFWPQQDRQIRISGRVEKTSLDESASYFHSRPDEAKLASWVSEQSGVISGRRELEEKMEELRRKFKDKQIPLPPAWGGYRLIPDGFEFWQGREHRLNDRLRYRKDSGRWIIERLQP